MSTTQPELWEATPRASTQASRILAYLQRGNAIDPVAALDRFGCFRLAARIKDLRDDGHAIATERVTNDHGVSFARYRLDR